MRWMKAASCLWITERFVDSKVRGCRLPKQFQHSGTLKKRLNKRGKNQFKTTLEVSSISCCIDTASQDVIQRQVYVLGIFLLKLRLNRINIDNDQPPVTFQFVPNIRLVFCSVSYNSSLPFFSKQTSKPAMFERFQALAGTPGSKHHKLLPPSSPTQNFFSSQLTVHNQQVGYYER